jgi:hypothetical protein
MKAGKSFMHRDIHYCHVTTLVITEPTRKHETVGLSDFLKADFVRLDIEGKSLTKIIEEG